MEPTGWIIALLIVFGSWNYVEKESAQNEVEELKGDVASYIITIEDLEKVIKENDTILVTLEKSSEVCKNNYLNTLERINSFSEVNRIKDLAIKNLEESLINSDFAECRVPDGIALDR